MIENTNKAIAINSLINYTKMGINTVLALLTTRYALKALGADDFGLFSVLGSIISFIGIFNTIMLSTSNRFLSVAIGRGNEIEINKQFNVNLFVFLMIALLMLVISYPIGTWYIKYYINYDGLESNAMLVFFFSIIGSIVSTIATPYNGLLMAKERFVVFSSVEVASHAVRCIVAFLLVSYFEEKLLIYTCTMSIMTAFPAFVYWLYCKVKFGNYVKWNFVKDWNEYKAVLSFSGWVGYGAIACLAKNQGAAIIVNLFFNTIMNTALGIANSLNTYVTMFSNNLTQPMQPQITKSYAIGNMDRTNELLVMSTRFSFMLMLLIGAPFFVGADYLLELWLGEVPKYASSFTVLLIIDTIIQSFNSGISTVMFASGKIALYQVIINTLRLISIIVAFFVLKSGAEPESLFYVYIIFSLLVVFATQWCLRHTLKYDTMILVKRSYIPSLLILVLFMLFISINIPVCPFLKIIITLFYLIIVEYFVGLNKSERIKLGRIVTSRLK